MVCLESYIDCSPLERCLECFKLICCASEDHYRPESLRRPEPRRLAEMSCSFPPAVVRGERRGCRVIFKQWCQVGSRRSEVNFSCQPLHSQGSRRLFWCWAACGCLLRSHDLQSCHLTSCAVPISLQCCKVSASCGGARYCMQQETAVSCTWDRKISCSSAWRCSKICKMYETAVEKRKYLFLTAVLKQKPNILNCSTGLSTHS